MSGSYHVFLSFKGQDTGKTFTDHLYTALDNAGFQTFRYDQCIERGEDVNSEQQNAIRQSRSSIVVFSKDYASSKRCLDELCLVLERRRTTRRYVVLPIFYDVDPSDVRKQTGNFGKAFRRHEKEYNKIEVEKWRAALREVGNLAGMELKNQEDGHESKFIKKIVGVIEHKLHLPAVVLPPCLIGIESRSKYLNHWIRGQPDSVGIAAICGIGGIGKTTLAKFVYEKNKRFFDGHSFLEDVRDTSKTQNGLIHLQKKLLFDVAKRRDENIRSVDGGILKIQDALCSKRILLILDDVGHRDHIDGIIGMRNWFHPGSKIIITTRHEDLVRESYNLHDSNVFCNVFNVELLNYGEAYMLFNRYAFGQDDAPEEYAIESRKIVDYCIGLPMALIVLARSLRGKASLDIWRSTVNKLQEIPNDEIMKKLRISYESLPDDHDRDLFLFISCFFIGVDLDLAITILDECEYHTAVGIDNLKDRCLLWVDNSNKLRMHQLIRDMGRDIVRLESPRDPGNRRLLWRSKDSIKVLREKSGTRRIEAFALDTSVIEGGSSENPGENEEEFEVDAFSTIRQLKILHLKSVRLNGSYESLPKSLRWLSWEGFSHDSTPDSLSLDGVVVLDMHHSSLKQLWTQQKFLWSLKILDLGHSYLLSCTPDFSSLPNLTRLILEYCTSLVEIHESIGCLKKLLFLNLKECKNLEKLPDNITKLKSLEALNISYCSKIRQLDGLNKLVLKVLIADGLEISGFSPSRDTDETTSEEADNISFEIQVPESSTSRSRMIDLCSTLVILRLRSCFLSDDDFPMDLSSVSTLRILDLSGNPFRSLPDFIPQLYIDRLYLNSCRKLKFLEVPPWVTLLDIADCISLRKITHGERATQYPVRLGHGFCPRLVESENDFKIEPLENVNGELIEDLGLNNLKTPQNIQVMLASTNWCSCSISPIQGLYEVGAFSVFIPGKYIPRRFSHRWNVSRVSLHVPDIPNRRVRGLNICVVYDFTFREEEWSPIPSNNRRWYHKAILRYRCVPLTIEVCNIRKRLIWAKSPSLFGIPMGEDEPMMMWFCHLNIGNLEQLEAGDELIISATARGHFRFKELGVNFIYNKHQDSSNRLSVREIIGESSHSCGTGVHVRNCWYKPEVVFHRFNLRHSMEITDNDDENSLDDRTSDIVAENHQESEGSSLENANRIWKWFSDIFHCLACFFPS